MLLLWFVFNITLFHVLQIISFPRSRPSFLSQRTEICCSRTHECVLYYTSLQGHTHNSHSLFLGLRSSYFLQTAPQPVRLRLQMSVRNYHLIQKCRHSNWNQSLFVNHVASNCQNMIQFRASAWMWLHNTMNLTAFLACSSSHHLPITLAQLIRWWELDVSRNVSCTVGQCITTRPAIFQGDVVCCSSVSISWSHHYDYYSCSKHHSSHSELVHAWTTSLTRSHSERRKTAMLYSLTKRWYTARLDLC